MEYVFSDRISSLAPSAIREILKFTADPEVIAFAAGNPSAEAFPTEAVAKIAGQILAENPISALQYSISEGYTPLRDALKSWMKTDYHIGTEGDDLIVTSGAQQAIELTCKVLCNEGDTVLCEDPSFIGSLNAFRSYHVQLKGVPVEADGISIQRLEDALKREKNVRFLYLIPNFQNPSGITMSLAKRQEVYRLACKYNVIILEDNPYGDLRYTGEDIPTIKSMDVEGRVIYVGSFSKILSPGMRVGYVVAPKPVIGKLTVAKQVSDVHTTILSQLICHRFLTEYDIHAHIAGLRTLYKGKLDLMLSELDRGFGGKVKYTRPEGGLFLWATLPEGVDMMQFCRDAVARKVAVVPGTAFLADESGSSQSFRMNYSTPSDDNIVKGVRILSELIAEMIH